MTRVKDKGSGGARAEIDQAHGDLAAGQMALFSPEAARRLTDEVKADAAALWAKLLRLYEGGAHTVLGYSSWGAYCDAEFGMSQGHSSRILQAGRVVEALADIPTGISKPESERVARELVPLLDQPEDMAEAWQEARDMAEDAGREPTAADARAAVQRQQGIDPHDGLVALQRQIVETAAETKPRPAPPPERLRPGRGESLERATRAAVGQPTSPPAGVSRELRAWEAALRSANVAIKAIRDLPEAPDPIDDLFYMAARDMARLLADASAQLIDKLPDRNTTSIRRVK